MSAYPFWQVDEESLPVIEASVDSEEAFFAIDTGASQTIIDLNFLLILGYQLNEAREIRRFETANGIIEAYIFNVHEFDALGTTIGNFEVGSFDFLARGLASEYIGLIGLDFFRDQKLCIDFRLSEITVS